MSDDIGFVGHWISIFLALPVTLAIVGGVLAGVGFGVNFVLNLLLPPIRSFYQMYPRLTIGAAVVGVWAVVSAVFALGKWAEEQAEVSAE